MAPGSILRYEAALNLTAKPACLQSRQGGVETFTDEESASFEAFEALVLNLLQ